MIKFSWKKVNDKLGWNPYNVLDYFFLKQGVVSKYSSKKVPKEVQLLVKQPYPKGSCFIRNINEVLIEAERPNDLYMYLELASKRSIFDYHMRGALYLPLPLVEEYHLDWVKLNPLLKIENNKIYFKYEQENNSEY